MSEKKFSHTVATGGTRVSIRESAKDSHPILEKIFEMLKARGWAIQIDQSVDSLISDNYFQGKKGDLLFKSHRYPTGFEIEFYQEVNAINQNGGYYDFDKLKLMPYLIRCRFLIEKKYINELLVSEGYKDSSDPVHRLAFDKVMHRIKSSGHYKEGIELPSYEFDKHQTDRDGEQIKNGQTKYFRDGKGRLMRGNVYYSLNNMWHVILNEREYTVVYASNLFDLKSDKDRAPKVYSREMPYRIKKEKARDKFNEAFSYSVLREVHIGHLQLLISTELAGHDADMGMSLKSPLKKDLVVLKTKGLKYASIKVNGSYFDGREGITFNQGGFIGFAGWASGYNLKPFVVAFEKWLDWLNEVVEVAA